MELNLRKARVLEKAIQNYIDSFDHNKCRAEVRIKGSLEDATKLLDETASKYRKDFSNLVQLSKIRFQIRSGISNKNESSGITALMNEREQTLNLQKIFNAAPRGNSFRPSVNEIREEITTRSSVLDRSSSSAYQQISLTTEVNAVSKEDTEYNDGQVLLLKRRIEDLDDMLAQKNLSTRVALGDEDVKLLRSVGLI